MTTPVLAMPGSSDSSKVTKQKISPYADKIQAILGKAKQLPKIKKPGSVASRVRITVTGHFPFNGSYPFGGAGLHCADLLGPGEHFPSGVTCTNL